MGVPKAICRLAIICGSLILFAGLSYFAGGQFFGSKFFDDKFIDGGSAYGKTDWQNIDQKAKGNVGQLNVGLKIKLANKYWVEVKGLSRQKNYYVFDASTKDCGYQVVGRGSAFVIALANGQNTLFVTSKHVLENGKLIADECEKYYVASAFYWQRYKNEYKTFDQFLQSLREEGEKGSTAEVKTNLEPVDEIWSCYDRYLSEKADPGRLLFNKYKKLLAIRSDTAYFIHLPGPKPLPPLQVDIYKLAQNKQADLAVLKSKAVIKGLSLAGLKPGFTTTMNEEIQLIGYPAKDSASIDYEPSFSSGKITKTAKNNFEFSATLGKGFSGGPVVNSHGQVIGIIMQRMLANDGTISNADGKAIKIEELKNFLPSLK